MVRRETGLHDAQGGESREKSPGQGLGFRAMQGCEVFESRLDAGRAAHDWKHHPGIGMTPSWTPHRKGSFSAASRMRPLILMEGTSNRPKQQKLRSSLDD